MLIKFCTFEVKLFIPVQVKWLCQVLGCGCSQCQRRTSTRQIFAPVIGLIFLNLDGTYQTIFGNKRKQIKYVAQIFSYLYVFRPRNSTDYAQFLNSFLPYDRVLIPYCTCSMSIKQTLQYFLDMLSRVFAHPNKTIAFSRWFVVLIKS